MSPSLTARQFSDRFEVDFPPVRKWERCHNCVAKMNSLLRIFTDVPSETGSDRSPGAISDNNFSIEPFAGRNVPPGKRTDRRESRLHLVNPSRLNAEEETQLPRSESFFVLTSARRVLQHVAGETLAVTRIHPAGTNSLASESDYSRLGGPLATSGITSGITRWITSSTLAVREATWNHNDVLETLTVRSSQRCRSAQIRVGVRYWSVNLPAKRVPHVCGGWCNPMTINGRSVRR